MHAHCRAQAARGRPCAWCGARIDVAIPYPHPHSFAADHARELCEGGAPYEVAPMHKVCNEAKELARRKAEYAARYAHTHNASREW